MKYYTHILSLILSAAFLFQACSYLDVVPDETPDEKDAFQNPTMAERYLYSCYSFLPNPRHETASLDLMTADEVVTPWEHETFANFPKGNYNASEPVISYWNTLFGGIRRCYILLENIDAVPNMTEANLRIYKGEAKFMIAYYHFLLLKNYGPIPLIKGVMSIDMDKADFPERDSYDHRKMIMIDNYIAYTGSMNMVDPRYFKQDSGVGQWIDLMARMEGPVATSMGIVYSCDWEIETGKRILPPPPDVNIMPFEEASGHTIHTIASGPGFPEDLIHQALLTAAYAAKEHLIMTTPYFVPSDDLLHAICTAAQRGVDVSIILPRKNDSLLVGWASRAFFTELLAAGVKIYQFEGGLLHTKSVLVDGELSLVGTVNLDMRSLWLNFEITLVIDDAGFGSDLAAVQDDYISRSRLLDARLWLKRPLWQRIAERLFYFFSPLL